MGTYPGAGEDQVQDDEGAFVFDADAVGRPLVIPVAPATPVARDTRPARDESDRLFGEVQDRMAHEFARGSVEPEVTALEVPIIGPRASIAKRIAPPTEPGSSELEESIDRDRAFATVVELMASAFAIDRVLDENTAPRAVPPFEPLEVGEDLSTGEAPPRNRGAEEVGIVAPEVDRSEGRDVRGSQSLCHKPEFLAKNRGFPGETPTYGTDSQLSHALRLTREAMFAWANLLHGPAVVTISR